MSAVGCNLWRSCRALLRVLSAPGHMHGLHAITESSHGWTITHRSLGCSGLESKPGAGAQGGLVLGGWGMQKGIQFRLGEAHQGAVPDFK
jgi:hypothetical protein